MRRSLVLLLPLMALGVLRTLPASENYKGLTFATPRGWTSGLQDGQFLLVPSDMTEETAVVVILSGAEKLGRNSFESWLQARLAGDLAAQGKLIQDSPVQRGTAGSLQTLSTGRTVQAADGITRLCIYHALSDGRQAGLALVVTASDAGYNKYQPGIQALLSSLNIAGARPSSGPGVGGPPPAAGTKTQILVSDLVGHWTHSTSSHADYASRSTGAYAGSSTVAYGQGYDFAANGTYAYDFNGIWNGVHVKEKDSGSWGFQGGHLILRSQRGQLKTYQIIDYRTAPDGTASMTLLSIDYPPTEGNIGLYGEKLVRSSK